MGSKGVKISSGKLLQILKRKEFGLTRNTWLLRMASGRAKMKARIQMAAEKARVVAWV